MASTGKARGASTGFRASTPDTTPAADGKGLARAAVLRVQTRLVRGRFGGLHAAFRGDGRLVRGSLSRPRTAFRVGVS